MFCENYSGTYNDRLFCILVVNQANCKTHIRLQLIVDEAGDRPLFIVEAEIVSNKLQTANRRKRTEFHIVSVNGLQRKLHEVKNVETPNKNWGESIKTFDNYSYYHKALIQT